MGALSPVSMSCSTASVRPVRVDPRVGNKSEYCSRTSARRRQDPEMSDLVSHEGEQEVNQHPLVTGGVAP